MRNLSSAERNLSDDGFDNIEVIVKPEADATIEHVIFENGEWLIGRAQDRHGMWRRGGGTLVIRDCNDETHVFFGHVCGPDYISWGFGKHDNLKSFCGSVKESGFEEYAFPETY